MSREEKRRKKKRRKKEEKRREEKRRSNQLYQTTTKIKLTIESAKNDTFNTTTNFGMILDVSLVRMGSFGRFNIIRIVGQLGFVEISHGNFGGRCTRHIITVRVYLG